MAENEVSFWVLTSVKLWKLFLFNAPFSVVFRLYVGSKSVKLSGDENASLANSWITVNDRSYAKRIKWT